jgi:hypothetical protein
LNVHTFFDTIADAGSGAVNFKTHITAAETPHYTLVWIRKINRAGRLTKP